MKNNYDDIRFDDFKEIVEDCGITIDDFFDIYCEYSRLSEDTKTDLLKTYYSNISK